MIRRTLLLTLVALSAIVVTQAGAAEPAGPRLAIIAHDARHGSTLITVGPAGEALRKLITEPASDRPSWSADGGSFALAARGEWEGKVVAVARVDKGALRTYPRAFLNAGDPVMAPDGRSVAFPRSQLVKVLPGRENYLFKSSIWSLDVKSGAVRRLTPWRLNSYLTPSSYSPDGSKLAASSFGRQGPTAVAIDLSTDRLSLLAKEASEPAYSPDGSEVAFARWKNWRSSGRDDGSPPINELRVARVGLPSGSRLLLRRRGLLAWPSWDPSGARLTFTSSHVHENGHSDPEAGDKVMAVNADGTCLTRVFTDPDLTLYGAAWQPGPGREAGRISC